MNTEQNKFVSQSSQDENRLHDRRRDSAHFRCYPLPTSAYGVYFAKNGELRAYLVVEVAVAIPYRAAGAVMFFHALMSTSAGFKIGGGNGR